MSHRTYIAGFPVEELRQTELDAQERFWRRATFVLAVMAASLLVAHVVVRFA